MRGLSALLTTFGVGELSAINGIAGAYSERVPILHIVGVPSTKLQSEGALLHHTLGDGQFNAYETATRPFTKAQAFLRGPRDAAQEIDRVLKVALETAHPTYLSLPTDLVFHPVPASLLDTPVIPETPVGVDQKDVLPTGEEIDSEGLRMVNFVKDEVVRLWDQAKNPIFLVDACVLRYGCAHLVQDLVNATGAKYFSTPLGKGALPEDFSKGFGGVYIGDLTNPDVKEAVEAADLTILVGSLPSDFNTGEFTAKRPKEQTIELHSDHTAVQFAEYAGVSFHTLLPLLTASLKKKATVEVPKDGGLVQQIPEGAKDEMVKQEAFWPLMGTFFREDDIILAETGTSSFGMIDVKLPTGASFISQVLYGSIGFATPATLGAAIAAKEAERPRRTILFTGDGSLQLTVQDISTMIRQGVKPILVVLNNEAYVIERVSFSSTETKSIDHPGHSPLASCSSLTPPLTLIRMKPCCRSSTDRLQSTTASPCGTGKGFWLSSTLPGRGPSRGRLRPGDSSRKSWPTPSLARPTSFSSSRFAWTAWTLRVRWSSRRSSPPSSTRLESGVGWVFVMWSCK